MVQADEKSHVRLRAINTKKEFVADI
jgi:hypothetical protein